ncbi:nuclease-related domain-containing DEAD/DEAH box helicase [Ruegeria sp. HKCCD6604]|uniref:nuclease-related domain-containing DEAD/DEAH box helicase n=1 Tax=Ruegeria sp. HKCCD6604 TaxID=2683000 RepID=UPI00149293B5|nr:nuclease-related domain-containing protein [Ruegeria sp. HKCCD6604]NOC91934.1 UvrD-helicase domain-containing protein [Ruegeria sp. HKCCD6604]
MKQRVVYPPLSEHAQLRQPLTVGEERVLQLFNKKLSDGWEIYIQPHLNGLRPDFVLLHPNGGIGVFEVKDWNLASMQYFTEKEVGGHSLWAKRDGKTFCVQKDNPVSKVNLYKKEIFDLYCPRLQKGNGWAAITAGVIFPFARTNEVKNLFEPFLRSTSGDTYAKYQPVSGMEELSSGDISSVFPESFRTSSKVMSEDHAKDLRGWLVEPDFSTRQRTPLTLDRNQRSLAETRTETGFRRIKGPAGSGKSLVLAARAARLANEGKSVLVATFNITLWHYLRDLIVRDLETPSNIQNIQFTHFHLWCKHACHDAGWEQKYNDLWKSGHQEDILNNILPKLAEEALSQPGAKSYDAILVDEGQDYHPLWWNVLRKACNPNGEMLLVADATQDVYGTAQSWTDDVMKGAGFRGDWSQLSVSYRLPSDAMDLARNFAEAFLPKDTIDLPEPEQGAFDFGGSHLRWVQCDPHNAEEVCSDEILALMRQTGKNDLANADITVLVGDMKSGSGVVDRLSDYRIHAVSTFSKDPQESRRRKMGFYMGDARIKATTLHSFKGWESRLLVVYVTEAIHAESLALVYAGLTRLKRSREGSWLTVVCSASTLERYGQTFPEFINRKVNSSVQPM